MPEPEVLKEQDRQVMRWMIGLPIALIAVLVFGLVGMMAWYGRPDYKVGMYDAHHPAKQVTYRGERLHPAGQLVKIADTNVAAVGVTDEGYLIYAPRVELGGGGGPHFGAKPPAYQHLYLRTSKGVYQPLQVLPLKTGPVGSYWAFPSGPSKSTP
ncbi:MAG TPA: hypothetical protein V6D47_01710 [Oscillatoriaceae cyanobacterium]